MRSSERRRKAIAEPSVDAAEQRTDRRCDAGAQGQRGEQSAGHSSLENGGDPDQRVTRPWQAAGPAGARVLVGAFAFTSHNNAYLLGQE